MRENPAQLTREQRRLAALLLRQRGLDPAQMPIPRRADASRAPLSSTQQRLWVSGRAASGTSYGNVPVALRIRGSLNLDSLARALSLVVARHEVLRTTFRIEDGQPIQRIHPAAPVTIPVEDLRASSPPERERRFATRVEEEARRPFDPAAETMLRASAFQLDAADWGLVLVSHHLVTDGWGARLLLDELSSACRAFAEGSEPDLPRLAVQYGDYAAWDVERIESGELEAQRAHWIERLAGAPRQLALPFDRPPSGSEATESVGVSLSRDLSEDLRRLSRTRGVTPYVTLLAGFKALMQRCADQDDIVIGTILSRRTRSETEPLIGNFGNNLLLRTTLDGDPSLIEVVDRTAATMRDALAHSDVPLELVAQAAPIPAFHVMFILRDGRFEERLALPDARTEGIEAASGAATLDLILDITDGSRGIEGHLEYRTARFAPDTMHRLARAFEEVVTRMVQEPEAPLSTLPRFHAGRSVIDTEQPRIVGEEPATHTEQVLARLWREWLEVENVYRDDNFFLLGGDSLRAVYVLEQTEKELGHRLRPEDLNRATLGELAALCDGRVGVVAAEVDRHVPTLAVRRVDPLQFGEQIKRLFEREGLPNHIAFFDRAYPSAVKDGARSWIALGDSDEVIGHIAMLPHRFTCGDSQYTGALGANLVMDRRHRNLTNAMALVETAMSDLENQKDVDFVFGDPNEDARSILSSVGGFMDVGVLARFALPVAQPGILDPAVSLYLALKLRNGRHAPMELERRSAVAFDPGEIELPSGRAPTLRAIHPPALYPRRLEGYPSERDEWYLFGRDSERVAAVLVRRFQAGDRAHLCCVWRQPGIALGGLMRPIVADLRRRGVHRLQAYSLLASPLGRELRAAGFRHRDLGAPFIARPCSPRGRSLLESGVEWEITDLDCDRGLDQ